MAGHRQTHGRRPGPLLQDFSGVRMSLSMERGFVSCLGSSLSPSLVVSFPGSGRTRTCCWDRSAKLWHELLPVVFCPGACPCRCSVHIQLLTVGRALLPAEALALPDCSALTPFPPWRSEALVHPSASHWLHASTLPRTLVCSHLLSNRVTGSLPRQHL